MILFNSRVILFKPAADLVQPGRGEPDEEHPTKDADTVDYRAVFTLFVAGYVPATVAFQQIDDD